MTSVSSTRLRILEALAAAVLEGGLSDFSVQGIADRCGISHRTVYRHFPTRESLLDGLVLQVSEAMRAAGGAVDIEMLDDLPGATLHNFSLFNANENLAQAAVRFSVGTAIENRDRRDRDDDVADAVGALDLGRDDAGMVAGVLRHLSSSRTWLLLRDTGLDPDQAASAAAWAVEVLIDAARTGRVPSTITPPESPKEAHS
jgi:AcrR family transcriptional regulator